MCGVMASTSKKSEDDYRAEDDLRTLTRAEEIRGDNKRMAACKRMHTKQKRSMSRVGRSLGSRR